MALLAMPFVITNLGGEMVYILEQRLRAQSIPWEKSVKVLHDVVRTMFSGKFISEVFKPDEIYSNQSTRQIFERLAHSSIMRLSESSMDKLYDLMTMGFKYQLLACKRPADILEVTLRHTETVRNCCNDAEVIAMVSAAEDMIRAHYKSLMPGDWTQLRHALCRFFHDRRIKVSLFLQEGIQSSDGRITLRPSEAHGSKQSVGTVRMFSSSGAVSETYKADTAVFPHHPDHPVPLGGNLYAKDRPAVQRPSGLAGPKSASSASPPTAEPSMPSSPPVSKESMSFGSSNSRMSFNFAQPSKQGADEYFKKVQTGEAKQELNLLASLIGPSTKPVDNFKINLFPEPLPVSGSGIIPKRNPADDIITIDNCTKSTGLESIMKDFDIKDDKAGDEEDDLLDLMDAA
ncbi:hypothetical protein CYMTET_28871 [Cymbomonas tetramitiformis]|uniref:Uncharacterized protein n=1 Tax=Cymbomonas tetramitiformis TaxID=36881 RepID=A0AAE0KVI6_9CHLO|nr:hypothetical protein CYMTET_28871 [Cymbomonas tetramitiformis]